MSYKFSIGLLLGAAAGATIGYLCATAKGQEILDDLKSAFLEAGGELKGTAKKMGSDLGSVVEKGKQWAKTNPS